MSTDYNNCNNCGIIFTNDNRGEAISCPKCGEWWCNEECAIQDGFIINEEDYEKSWCPYCDGGKNNYSDIAKLRFALGLLNMSEEKLIQEMIENNY